MQTSSKAPATRSAKAKAARRVDISFEEAALALGCDEDEARFDAALRKVVRHKPVKDAKPEPEKLDDGE